MIRRTYRYRVYPNSDQAARLTGTLSLCCELYNAALQERRDAWLTNRLSVGFPEQSAQLVEIKRVRPEYGEVYSQALQDVLHRVDKAFKAFYARLKAGAKAGYPRFRSLSRYDSLTYPQHGFSIRGTKLRLSKIGEFRIKLHRPVEGKVKTLTVKREAGKWYALFTVEREAKPLPPNGEAVGIDVGLTVFATLSDGSEIENPRFYREATPAMRRTQRKVARRKKGSRRRRKAVGLLRKAHARVRNRRADFHHKVSRRLVEQYGLIAVEDLNFEGLASGMLAREIMDAGWSAFISKLLYKAEEAGRVLLKVDCRGTSQTCLCGAGVPKALGQRWHECAACGLSAPRDHVSARLILRRGLRLQALRETEVSFA